MAPTMIFHVGGKFRKIGRDVIYEGGEVSSYPDLDPDVICTWDLAKVLKDEGKYVDDFPMYFKNSSGWRLLSDDAAVLEFLEQFKDKDEYHVYIRHAVSTAEEVHLLAGSPSGQVPHREGQSPCVRVTRSETKKKHESGVLNSEKRRQLFQDKEKVVENPTSNGACPAENAAGGSTSRPLEFAQHDAEGTTTEFVEDVWIDEEKGDSDSEFEAHQDWVSDEDIEDREKIARRVKNAKENLKRGIPTTYHSDDEFEKRQAQIAEKEPDLKSDDVGSEDETDNEDEVADHGVCRKSRFTKYNPNLATPYFEVGMIFNGMDEARQAINKYCLAYKKDLRVKKSDPEKVRMICSEAKCLFVLHISWSTQANAFQIKTLKMHRCGVHLKCKKVTPKAIAEKFHKRIRADPRWKLRDMMETVREVIGFSVDKNKCSRAKKLVLHLTEGCFRDEYAILWTYAEEIRKANIGSTVHIMVNRDNPERKPKFQRMYVCFGAVKKGFLEGCRKLIALDGCFLKGLCKGELLAAIGRDANDQMYHVAWAVVEVESRNSWEWFLKELRDDLCIDNGAGWCFSSDQMKGLVPAIADLFPAADHRLCARHIWSNWRKKYGRRELQKTFWECAKASTPAFFSRAYEKLSSQDEEAAKGLVSIDPKQWSRAYFSTAVKCDFVDNNMSESFNASILEARFKAIYSMLDDIRIMVMSMIATKRAEADKWDKEFCPKILMKYDAHAREVPFCHITHNGKNEYEVKHHEDRFVVSVPNKTCSCRVWALTGIPCAHAIICLAYEGETPENYISDHFTTQKWRDMYANVLEPMDGPKAWIRSEYEAILPPDFRIMPGRPKKKRVRSVEEKDDNKRARMKRVYTSKELLAHDKNDPERLGRVGRQLQCKNCDGFGHNSRGCKKPKRIVEGEGQCKQRGNRRATGNAAATELQGDGTASSSSRPPAKKKAPFVGVGTYYNIEKHFGVLDPGLKGSMVLQYPPKQGGRQEGERTFGGTQESTTTTFN